MKAEPKAVQALRKQVELLTSKMASFSPGAKPGSVPTAGAGAAGGKKICFSMRDTGNCSKGDQCPYEHDKEKVKAARAAKKAAEGGDRSALAEPKAKGKGK